MKLNVEVADRVQNWNGVRAEDQRGDGKRERIGDEGGG